MKALEILNNDNVFDESYISENNYKKLISEAIKELEELNNKSCEGCIYNTYAFENEQCTYCSRRCVDFYEAKGE